MFLMLSFCVLGKYYTEEAGVCMLIAVSSSGCKELVLQTSLRRSYTGLVGPPLLHILG